MEYKKLGHIAKIQTGPFGSQLHQSDYIPTGIPCIMPCNIGSNLNIICDNIAYISEEDLNRLAKHKTQEGDIVYSRRGDIEKCAYISSRESGWLCGTGCLKVSIDSTIALPKYVAYLLSTPESKAWLVGNAVGTTMLNLNTTVLSDFPICLPDLDTQKKVVEIIDSIADKIELNKRINDNLEQQAQVLYKSWFVDFEPFKDGEFVESEMGEIPVGWTVVKFSDLTDIPKKTINPQRFPDTIFKHYSLPACDNGLIPENQTGKDIMSNKIILQNNTTLFSKLNPRIKRIWFTCEVQPNSICSTEFIPYRATNENESGYIFSIINSEAFYASVMGCVNGATGSHQRFHAEDTDDFLCAYNKEAANEFSQHIDVILKQMHDLRQENVKLASTRDTLLPKLMSGELKINEIDC